MKVFILFIHAFALTGTFALADGDHAAPKGGPRLNEKSAVTAFDPEEGFKMSNRAFATLGIQFKKVEGAGPWSVPEKALVRIKHTSGVYRRYQDWISFVIVQVSGKKNGNVLIHSEDLQAGDEIAFEGASFLRLTEADLNADTVDSCSH